MVDYEHTARNYPHIESNFGRISRRFLDVFAGCGRTSAQSDTADAEKAALQARRGLG